MRDLQQIRRQVESVLKCSQDYPFNPHVKDIIDQWYEAKKPYIDLFGGETSVLLQSNVEIELTQEDLDRMFDSFIGYLEDNDLNYCFNETIQISISKFLFDNREGFFQNRVVKDYPTLKICKGAKLLKCFKFFIKDFDTCRKAQDIASRYIQDIKITGNLYLSVDPLDFLTISENNSNWRSCHSLDGDFRMGNLNYMIDDTTLIAFLANEKKEQLKCMPAGLLWNNKKWRMLVHTNNWESIIYYNRQYPFSNTGLILKVYNGIVELREDNWYDMFLTPNKSGFKKIVLRSDEPPITLEYNFILGSRERLYDMRDIVDDSEGKGYDDLVYSSHYAPVFSLRRKASKNYDDATYATEKTKDWDAAFHEVFDIKIGKKCGCVKCGSLDIDRANSFLCEDCIALNDADEDLFAECEWCGRRLYPDDKRYNFEGDIICETCNSACTTSGNLIID